MVPLYVTKVFLTKSGWAIIHTVTPEGEAKVEFIKEDRFKELEFDAETDLTILGDKPRFKLLYGSYNARGSLVSLVDKD